MMEPTTYGSEGFFSSPTDGYGIRLTDEYVLFTIHIYSTKHLPNTN